MFKKGMIGLFVLGFLVTGCAEPVTQKTKQMMAKDINCATAQKDIETLEKEKKRIHEERVKAGVRSFVPVSAVAGILKGTWRDRTKVFSGEYVEAMEKKIKEIKEACGIK